MVKNKIVVSGLTLLMIASPVYPVTVETNLSRVFSVAASASVVPTNLFVRALNQATNGKNFSDKSKKDKSKIIAAYAAPILLQVISDIAATTDLSDKIINVVKILIIQASIPLLFRGSENIAELAQKFADLGNK